MTNIKLLFQTNNIKINEMLLFCLQIVIVEILSFWGTLNCSFVQWKCLKHMMFKSKCQSKFILNTHNGIIACIILCVNDDETKQNKSELRMLMKTQKPQILFDIFTLFRSVKIIAVNFILSHLFNVVFLCRSTMTNTVFFNSMIAEKCIAEIWVCWRQ